MKYNIDKVLNEINMSEEEVFTPTFICCETYKDENGNTKRKENWAGITRPTLMTRIHKKEIEFIELKLGPQEKSVFNISKDNLLDFIQKTYGK